jgi:hypothetical protein
MINDKVAMRFLNTTVKCLFSYSHIIINHSTSTFLIPYNYTFTTLKKKIRKPCDYSQTSASAQECNCSSCQPQSRRLSAPPIPHNVYHDIR